MSTLRVDNLQASDGLSPAFDTTNIPKMRLKYDGVTPTVDDSDNVSSVTDNATGDYTPNINNDFSDANYAIAEGCGLLGGLTGNMKDAGIYGQAAGTFDVFTKDSGAETNEDADLWVICSGDLA